jgi:thymidylate synthase
MRVIDVRNVCEALPAGLDMLLSEGAREETRAGPALVAPWPVVTMTKSPRERVLFSSVRDANPLFHMYEAIWMLAGRDDAAPLSSFVRRFGSDYGERDGRVHGAYGRRWRSAFGFDQLDAVVETLRRDPGSRQSAIQMWDCRTNEGEPFDFGDRCEDLTGSWKDRPCNTHVYLRVRGGRGMRDLGHGNVEDYDERVLDLTVCCRSNDMCFGAHGANSVHFSVLQEYLAAQIGVGVGTMYQVSNNYHMYVSEMERLHARALKTHVDYPLIGLGAVLQDDRYASGAVSPSPMFESPDAIDEDVRRFCAWWDVVCSGATTALPTYVNPWFRGTLEKAMLAHWHHKQGGAATAEDMARQIDAPDWRRACLEWLERRRK